MTSVLTSPITVLEETAKIVTKGRSTGIPHIVRVRFVSLDGKFYAIGGTERSDWVLNSLKQKRVKFRLQEYVWNVQVRRTDSDERTGVLDAFSKKYGARVVRD